MPKTVSTSGPAVHDFKIYEGDSMIRQLTIKDQATGDPIDLSDADIVMKIVAKLGAEAVLELTEGDGLTVSGVGNNVITIDHDMIVGNLDAKTYFYDIRLTFPTYKITYLKGSIIVDKRA